MPSLPLTERLRFAVVAFLWAKLLLKSMHMYSEAKKYFVSPGEKEPDLVKTYPVRKSLAVRIFFPPNYDRSNPSPRSAKLPTLLTIHGGGFVIGQPNDNDSWNRAFAKRHSFLVVALNYAKAPASPFPNAVHDIEALVACVLADSTLPVDTERVALGGWSAGGNLALAAGSLPSLRGRLRAVVPFYPVVDFVPSFALKARARRYKPSLGGFRARETDFLLSMTDLFTWAYVPAGQRCDNPLLSPFYLSRADLPPNIFMVACELDMLSIEAWRMACKLAGKRVPGLDEVVGCQEPVGKGVLITEGDERFAWEVTLEDGSRYKWLLVPDTIHGFDQDHIGEFTKDPVLQEDAQIKTAKVVDMVGQWLLDGPLKAEA
ncbi:uncharacterized protein THITE_2144678 [Thermothielavioides terrestris NRRL 8126]|uniref:Alpha/beta hydrolase fold-3 domain-containing protein n=1 Tax=Thermothielavioides terrestris (strain ATCC 38088 / NRRL 8126) TaxID=578455 RepID=G2R096_THETT|nr:uncharacterized protein THITE_2144678 [Thermothielavioides terrestris NRRL 8126]AEO67264.1 hypothetical protein THITE_2144678 [Thermothielavioides terrestris NRRL 8126]